MVKPQSHSANHPIETSSSNASKGSLSKGAQVAIIVVAVIIGMLLITLCYYAIKEWRRARDAPDTFSWNKVTRKTMSAAMCLWIFLPVGRMLKRRKEARVRS
jgi:hypothetical protein